MIDPSGSGGLEWLDDDRSVASEVEELTLGSRHSALLSGWLGRGALAVLAAVLVVIGVVSATSGHHGARAFSSARSAPVPGTAGVTSAVPTSAAVEIVPSVAPGPTDVSSYAPGRVAVTAVLVDGRGSSGSWGTDGTVIWAQELRNALAVSLTLAGAVQVQLSPSVHARVVTVEIAADLPNVSPVAPPPIRLIGPGQTVLLWVQLHVDCSQVKRSNRPPASNPVVALINIDGFAGPGRYPVDEQFPGPPSIAQRVCFSG